MRCACTNCGTYMIQSEGLPVRCACPDCGASCNACMGTHSLITRDNLAALKDDPRFQAENFPFKKEEDE